MGMEDKHNYWLEYAILRNFFNTMYILDLNKIYLSYNLYDAIV